MRYELPQFINIEDKIFGPFSFSQFVYLAGGGASAYVLWQILPTIIAIFFIIPIVGLALALAFYKVNNRPFIFMIQAGAAHLFRSKFYLWQQKKQQKLSDKPKSNPAEEFIPTTRGQSELKQIAFNLDMLDSHDPNANRSRKG